MTKNIEAMTAGNQPSSSGSGPALSSPDIEAAPTLVQEALAILKWLREPDYAEKFSLDDMTAWINERPVAGMCRVVDGCVGAAQGARVPKVRTSHHRNKEEAARLQELVAKRYAVTPSPGARSWTPDQFWEYVGGLAGEFEAGQMRDMLAAKGLSITSTDRATPACDCGFTPDVCATNHCHRKQIASAGLSPVPAGYSKLPDGVVCKCFKMWRAPDGSHWCCLPSPLPSTEGK